MNRTAAIVYRKQLKKAQAPNEPAAPAPRPQLPRYRSPPTGGEVAGAVTRGLVGAVPRAIRGLYDASQDAASRVPGTEGFRQQPLETRLHNVDRRSRLDINRGAAHRVHRFMDRPELREPLADAERRHLYRAYPSTVTSIIQDVYGRGERVPEALWRDLSSAGRSDRGLTPDHLRDVIGLPAHDIPLAATGPVAGHVTPRNIHSVTRAAAAALQLNPLGVLSALLQRQSQSYGPESYGKGAVVGGRTHVYSKWDDYNDPYGTYPAPSLPEFRDAYSDDDYDTRAIEE